MARGKLAVWAALLVWSAGTKSSRWRIVNRLSVKVSAPRMDGSSVWSVGGLIVAAGRLSQTVGGEYFSSLLGVPPPLAKTYALGRTHSLTIGQCIPLCPTPLTPPANVPGGGGLALHLPWPLAQLC